MPISDYQAHAPCFGMCIQHTADWMWDFVINNFLCISHALLTRFPYHTSVWHWLTQCVAVYQAQIYVSEYPKKKRTFGDWQHRAMVTGVAAYSKRLFTKCFLTLSLSLSLSICLFVSFSAVRKYVCVHLLCIRNATLVSCTTRQQPAYNQPAKKQAIGWLKYGVSPLGFSQNRAIQIHISLHAWALGIGNCATVPSNVCVYRTCRKVVANCVPAPSHTHTFERFRIFAETSCDLWYKMKQKQ